MEKIRQVSLPTFESPVFIHRKENRRFFSMACNFLGPIPEGLIKHLTQFVFGYLKLPFHEPPRV